MSPKLQKTESKKQAASTDTQLTNAQLDDVGVVGPGEKGGDEDHRYPSCQAHAAVETASRVDIVCL